MNQLIRLWVQPRVGVRQLAKKNGELAFIALVPAYGILMSLRDIINGRVDQSGDGPPGLVLLVSIFADALISLLLAFLGSFLLTWVSRRLGGRGSARDVRTVMAWGCVPCIPLLGIAVPLVLLSPDSTLFRPVLGLFYVLGLVMAVWGIVISVSGLSEVMAFSVPKSIGALVLSSLLGAAVAMVLMGIIIAVLKVIRS